MNAGALATVCDGSRDGSRPDQPRDPLKAAREAGFGLSGMCPVCTTPLASARAQYCSHACRQRAFRLRHPATVLARDVGNLTWRVRQRRALMAHTVYECPSCQARFLGERRCEDCNRFCRSLGLGGACPDCDALIVLADLLGEEVLR